MVDPYQGDAPAAKLLQKDGFEERLVSDLYGKGSAFLLADADAFWRSLIVSVFGKRYEQDVNIIVDKYVHKK